jgi:hypothetical protein
VTRAATQAIVVACSTPHIHLWKLLNSTRFTWTTARSERPPHTIPVDLPVCGAASHVGPQRIVPKQLAPAHATDGHHALNFLSR